MKFSMGNFSVKRYIFSFFLSFLITMLLCAIISVGFSFFDPPQWFFSLMGYFCYFSSAITAFFCATGAEKNGLVTGIVCADIYMLILIIAGMVFLKNSFPVNSALKIFSISSALGAVAGIAGINFKK